MEKIKIFYGIILIAIILMIVLSAVYIKPGVYI